MLSMVSYSKSALEPAMKVPEVILRAIAKKIAWWQAAEIIGISEWHTPSSIVGSRPLIRLASDRRIA